MAKFTRAEIRKIIGESCTDEIENQLVALHLGVVDPLKDDVTRYKADAEKLPGVQKELDDLKAQGDGGYKAKYEAEHKAFGDYKANVDAEKTTAAVCCPALQRRWPAGQAGTGRKRRYQGF